MRVILFLFSAEKRVDSNQLVLIKLADLDLDCFNPDFESVIIIIKAPLYGLKMETKVNDWFHILPNDCVRCVDYNDGFRTLI